MDNIIFCLASWLLFVLLFTRPAKSWQIVEAVEGSEAILRCTAGGHLEYYRRDHSSSDEHKEVSSCEFEGPHEQHVVVKNGEIVREKSHSFRAVDKNAIAILQVERKDQGVWKCKVYSPSRRGYAYFQDSILLMTEDKKPTVSTTQQPTSSPDEIKILDQSKTVEVREGSSSELWVRINRDVLLCRWMGPQGQNVQFQRPSDSQDEGHYAYSKNPSEGDLEKGFCRLWVPTASLMDHGVWRLQVYPKYHRSLHTKLLLHVYDRCPLA